MNRRRPGSGSGAELANARHVPPRIAIPGPGPGARDRDGDSDEFPSLANGHASPEKKQVVDAGLKSLDHCMLIAVTRVVPPPLSCALG